MRNAHLRLRIALVLACLLAQAAAQQSASADLARQIDQVVTSAMSQQQLPAVSVAVAIDGQITFEKSYGMDDLENSVPATTDTLFRTGSIAKPITAVAAMELVQQHKLDLDAPVQKYCPAFPQKQWTVTTRELMSHTAGVRHYQGDEFASTRHFKTTADGFVMFAGEPLQFEPGTRFLYSTYGYSVVGCAIEGASGQSYTDFVRENVFTSAGMTHSFVDDVFAIVPHRARGYQKVDGKVQNAGLMDSSYKIPGGGWVTTSGDLVRFAMALMDGKLLAPETLAQMWTSQKLRDGKETGYGLGFGIIQIAGDKGVAHSGSQQGTSTDIIIVPGRKFASAVMINMDGVNAGDLDRKIAEAVLSAATTKAAGTAGIR